MLVRLRLAVRHIFRQNFERNFLKGSRITEMCTLTVLDNNIIRPPDYDPSSEIYLPNPESVHNSATRVFNQVIRLSKYAVFLSLQPRIKRQWPSS